MRSCEWTRVYVGLGFVVPVMVDVCEREGGGIEERGGQEICARRQPLCR
jgi:hypothetical protein